MFSMILLQCDAVPMPLLGAEVALLRHAITLATLVTPTWGYTFVKQTVHSPVELANRTSAKMAQSLPIPIRLATVRRLTYANTFVTKVTPRTEFTSVAPMERLAEGSASQMCAQLGWLFGFPLPRAPESPVTCAITLARKDMLSTAHILANQTAASPEARVRQSPAHTGSCCLILYLLARGGLVRSVRMSARRGGRPLPVTFAPPTTRLSEENAPSTAAAHHFQLTHPHSALV